MTASLVDLAKSYLSHDVVDQISKQLGENEHNTQTALDSALPTLLSGLVQKSSQPGGLSSVMDLVAEVTTPNRSAGDVVEPVGGTASRLNRILVSTDGHLSNLLSMGSSIMASLFGDRVNAIASALATHSSIRQSSASSLLNLAGPVLLSVLGHKMADDELGLTGLGTLLKSQTGYIQQVIPAGIANLLDTPPDSGQLNPAGGATPASVNKQPGTGAMSRPAAAPASAAGSLTYTMNETDSGNRWLPWLLLGLGAIALFYILRSCSSGPTSANGAATSLSDSANVASDANTKLGTALSNAATGTLETRAERKLPTGVALTIPETGIESKLLAFITDESQAVDKDTWFNFTGLVFDTGKATLRPDSKEEVTNIAEILKAYPNVSIKIGGYTDNTGNAQTNQRLSADRASTVLNELVQLGITKSRLEAEGYGAAHPVADNDTEAGRAQNRRIAVRVTKK